MWIFVIIAIVALWILLWIYSLDRKIKEMNDLRGHGQSHWFWLETTNAVGRNKHFKKMYKTGSSVSNDDIKNLKDAKKAIVDMHDQWKKIPQKFLDRMTINITYLASENVYFIKPLKGNPEIVLRNDIDTIRLLYSAIIGGDEECVKEYLELSVYERLVYDSTGKKTWLISSVLSYNKGGLSILDLSPPDQEILCEYPIHPLASEAELNEHEFTVERSGGGDIYEDPFGEQHSIPTQITVEKNGVKFKQSIE